MIIEKYEIELKHSLDIDLMMYLSDTYGKVVFDHESFNDFINVMLMRGLHSYNEQLDERDD